MERAALSAIQLADLLLDSYNQRTMSRRVPLQLAIAVHKPLIQVRQFLSPLNRAG